MNEVSIKIGERTFTFEFPDNVTQEDIELAVITACEGIGGRPKDRG